jgi:hypothetical protein
MPAEPWRVLAGGVFPLALARALAVFQLEQDRLLEAADHRAIVARAHERLAHELSDSVIQPAARWIATHRARRDNAMELSSWSGRSTSTPPGKGAAIEPRLRALRDEDVAAGDCAQGEKDRQR